MTLDEIRESEKPFLIPADIAPLLGCDPYSISIAARDCPQSLGFPVVRVGNRTKIPRVGFLNFWTGEKAEATA